jgi:hypothetical protein
MSKQNKEPRTEHFRLSLVNDVTHKALWVIRFTRTGLFVRIISAVLIFLILAFCLLGLTPLRSFIPGYPDSKSRHEAITNAIRIDSLESVVKEWEFYSTNLRKVFEGADPVRIDSLINHYSADTSAMSASEISKDDSLLTNDVKMSEQIAMMNGAKRSLPIEGKHFFAPLKGVVSQPYDAVMHPYVSISAPANTVVMATLDGTVVYAGWSDMSGYSVIIQHDDDIISVYEHNQKLLCSSGDKVSAGAPIALVGNSGSVSPENHLHFELWYKGEAVDPAKYVNF